MIRYANTDDIKFIKKYDIHISKTELKNLVILNRVIVMYEGNSFIGWLRYNLFWDNTPFLNMIYLLDGERGKGYGSKLISFWEKEMKERGYDHVLTSTQSNELGQFFYRKNKYKDVGSLILPNQPLEIMFYKNLKDK